MDRFGDDDDDESANRLARFFSICVSLFACPTSSRSSFDPASGDWPGWREGNTFNMDSGSLSALIWYWDPLFLLALVIHSRKSRG